MQVAVLGLGRMGMQIAKRLQRNNFEVLTWNRSEARRNDFEQFAREEGFNNAKTFADEKELVNAMTGENRVFWVMLPQEAIEDFLFGENGLLAMLKPGDILIEGGNSFYKETLRREKLITQKGVIFFDAGTSGGVWGLERGFAIMVGGPKEHFEKVEPIFRTLSAGDNYGLVGPSGAGHFVKMVHNGIEYGMMEAIAEGYSIMEASEFKPDLATVTRIYQKGSVVSSWLIDLMADIYAKEDIAGTVGVVRATGEGEWTVNVAKEMGIDARVIADSLQVRKESEDPKNQDQYRNKILALLRKQFGGHEVTMSKNDQE